MGPAVEQLPSKVQTKEKLFLENKNFLWDCKIRFPFSFCAPICAVPENLLWNPKPTVVFQAN